MLHLYEELRRLVEALEASSIRYALAGGLAVSIYTTPRATEDIDLLIPAGGLDRAVAAAGALGFGRAGPPMRLASGRLEIQRLTKIVGRDILPVDLMMPIEPTLASLLEDRRPVTWEEREVWIVSVDALRALKRLRGSARDRADLEALGPDP
jgi:hypothetical protein